MKEIEIKLTKEMIMSLLQGQKLVYKNIDSDVVILPPVYGKFLKYENYQKIRSMLMANLSLGMPDLQAMQAIDDLFVPEEVCKIK